MKASNKGFTLLELMIAAAILLVAVMGIFTAIFGCIVLNDSNKNLVMAVNCCRLSLERLKGEAYTNITSAYVFPACVINNQAVVPSITVSGITAELKEVTVGVNWTERQRNRNFSLSTRIAR